MSGGYDAEPTLFEQLLVSDERGSVATKALFAVTRQRVKPHVGGLPAADLQSEPKARVTAANSS